MSFEIQPTIQLIECPTDDIASYIDGELNLARELELDDHFSGCQACVVELNQQKQFLRHLDVSLKHESELELPANFVKQIVANAESTVSGLRRPRERFNALFICAGLLLFVMFAMGTEAENLVARLSGVVEKAAAVGDIFGHFIYSLFVGLAVVVRTLASEVEAGAAAVMAISIIFTIFSLFVSRKVLSAKRV